MAVMLATSAAQVALLLLAASPLLFASASPSTVLVALLPSTGLTCLGGWLAFRAWRRLERLSMAAGSGDNVG
jgi:hypothetical protein